MVEKESLLVGAKEEHVDEFFVFVVVSSLLMQRLILCEGCLAILQRQFLVGST